MSDSAKYNSDGEEIKENNIKSSILSDSMDMCIPGGGSKEQKTPKNEDEFGEMRKNSKIEDSIFLSEGDDSDDG